jgi:hypothetical protein
MAKKSETNKANGAHEFAPIDRTSAGLRAALFDTIDRVRAGECTHTNANAIARLSTEIIKTVQVELSVQNHMAKFLKVEGALSTKKMALPSLEL